MRGLFWLWLVSPFLLAAAPRIAIFDEPGFPNASKRDAEFYRRAAGGTILRLDELGRLDGYDVLIFPHGGLIPKAAEPAVSALMSRGGTVIVAGDIQTPPPGPCAGPPSVRNAARLEFAEKYGLSCGGPLTFRGGRWINAPSGANYEESCSPRWFAEFDLKGWPNYAQSCSPQYMRRFNETISLSPAFSGTSLPKTLAPPSSAPGLARLVPGGNDGDYAFDVFQPLYLFSKPGGGRYPSFPLAGKMQEDRAADAFVYRRFRPSRFGSTLVVMGQVGRQLLESEKGDEVIREIIRIASSPLKGEFPHDYIRRVHALEKAMADCNDLSAELSYALGNTAVRELASGTFPQRISRMKALRSEFNRLNNRFDGLLKLRDSRQKIEDSALTTLSSEIAETSCRLKKELAPLSASVLPADHGNAAHPYGEMVFTAFGFGPWGSAGSDGLWKKVREIGITNSALISDDWELVRRQKGKFGLGCHYTINHIHRGHTDKERVSSGVFDPRTGSVRPVRIDVWGASRPEIDSALARLLRQADGTPGIDVVMFGDERDFQWSLWGGYMRGKFLDHLRNKYKDIAALNSRWDSDFPSFDSIELPLKRPESRKEHALWEDWSRFREIYFIDNEMRHWVELTARFAPHKKKWLYGSYNLQGRYPANGINYYEYGKLADPASLENGSLQPWKEVIAHDVTAFGKKHVNPEWADFYFPSGSRIDDMNRMRQSLWNEANSGTIGWFLYMGGEQTRRWHHTPLMTPAGNIQPAGFALREITRDFRAARRLFLDGRRAEPEVRIVYSPTTRRHTSWPGIETDKQLQCAAGYNEAFKRLHIPARVIDEQAVMEGKLPRECRFLFLPQADYLNGVLLEKLRKFMREGGTLIATPDSGTFDEYGAKGEFLLETAGVRPSGQNDPGFRTFKPQKLQVLFPEETRVILEYPDHTAAMTETRVGKGRLVITGLPIGREFSNSGCALGWLEDAAAALGMERFLRCDDPNLVIRPWILDGETYLACHYIHRAVSAPAEGSFPLSSAPAMVKFKIDLQGSFAVTDWLADAELPAEHADGITSVTGLIGNPGGRILKLTGKKGSGTGRTVSRKTARAAAVPAPSPSGKDIPLPYAGRLFADWSGIRLGEYIFRCESENNGSWQGKVFVTLEKNGRKLRRECSANSKVSFRFEDKTVFFDCREAMAFMPVCVSGTFSERTNSPESSGCRLVEKDGRLIFMGDGLYAAVLPKFGGRISELRLSPDSPNQLRLNESEFRKGTSRGYQNFGGIEYNPGMYQGPGWQIRFQYEILRNTRQEVMVKLKRSEPFSLPEGGKVSYEIIYRIQAGSPMLETRVRLYNELKSPAKIPFRTHPLFQIGGSCDTGDVLSWRSPEGVRNLPSRPGLSASFENAGGWFAFLDENAAEGIFQTFPAASVKKLYAWSGTDSCNAELHFEPAAADPGKCAEFVFGIAPVSGLNRIDGFADGILAELNFPVFRLISLRQTKQHVSASLLANGRPAGNPFVSEVDLKPGHVFTECLKTAPEQLPEGICEMTVHCGNAEFRQKFRIDRKSAAAELRLRNDRRKQLQKMLERYRLNPGQKLRHEIFQLSGEL